MLSLPVWAIDLGTAKANGLVGETPSGYLEATGNASSEVAALIKDINTQRRAKYQSIASSNGTALSAIEALAGETAIKKTAPGHFVKINGQWRKK